MSDGAERLLQAMLTDFKETGRTSFDSFFYKDYPEAAVGELAVYGYIEVRQNIMRSIELTVDAKALIAP